MPVKLVARIAVLVAITLTMQALGLPPQVWGPAVNALILLSSIFVGPGAGIIIGCLTPLLALSWQFLSPALAPALPYMILGNIVYVCCFSIFHRIAGRYFALLVGSLLKYLLMLGAINFILRIPQLLAATLASPELFSALLGGAIALVVVQCLDTIFGQRVFEIEKKVTYDED
jgi:hypothetical protein